MELKQYQTAASFLAAYGEPLAANEVRNNLVLGHCNNLADQHAQMEGAHFVGIHHGAEPSAVSIRLTTKAVLCSLNSGELDAAEIAEYYRSNNVQVEGVIGDELMADAFGQNYGRDIARVRTTLVQSLNKVNEHPCVAGSFRTAVPDDAEELVEWLYHFIEEEKHKPKRTPKELTATIHNLLAKGDIFVWDGTAGRASMGAIIRKTQNAAIIGLVYTPPHLRGKGYAQSLMQGLSTHILNSGYRESGLLVYEDNPTARKIYDKLGYRTVSRMKDIDF